MPRNRQFMLVLVFIAACIPGWASSNVDKLIEQGQAQAGAGKLDDALATLNSAVAQYPQSSLAFTRLGGVQVLRQEYQLSIKSFQQAVMLDQSNANAFVGLAVAYLHMGQYGLAREALNEAEKLDASKKAQIQKVLAWIDQRTSHSRQ